MNAEPLEDVPFNVGAASSNLQLPVPANLDGPLRIHANAISECICSIFAVTHQLDTMHPHFLCVPFDVVNC